MPGARSARVLALVVLVCLLVPLPAQPGARPPGDILVFAAASLKNALDDIVTDYHRATGRTVVVSLAASSTLAKQIENGAPADIFVSADTDWMDYLASRGLIRPATRRNLVGNTLVLVGPAGSAPLPIVLGFPLAARLGEGRLAMADTAAVPAGKYAKASLEALGVWASVAGRIAQAENVRAALALVARREAPLGIVFRTDAAAEPRVAVLGEFPPESHRPIVYPAAMTAASAAPGAGAFLDHLRSAAARACFEKHGFAVLK